MSERHAGPTCVTRLGIDWSDAGTLSRWRSTKPGPTGLESWTSSAIAPTDDAMRLAPHAVSRSAVTTSGDDEYGRALAAYVIERNPRRRGRLFETLVRSRLQQHYGIPFKPEVDLTSGTRFDGMGEKNGVPIVIEIKDVVRLPDLWLGKGMSRTQLPLQIEMILSNGGLYELIVSTRTGKAIDPFIVAQLKGLEADLGLQWRLTNYDCQKRQFTVYAQSADAAAIL